MANRLNEFEQNIKDTMENFSPEYSKASWEKISKQLPKRRFPYFKIAALLSVATVALVMVYIYNLDEKTTSTKSKSETTQILAETPLKKADAPQSKEIKQHSESVLITENKANTTKAPASKAETKPATTEKEAIAKPNTKTDKTSLIAEKKADSPNTNIKNKKEIRPLLLSANITEGCEPLEVIFNVKNASFNSNWHLESASLFKTNDSIFTYRFDKAGSYIVTLSGQNSNQRTETKIIVHPQPKGELHSDLQNNTLWLSCSKINNTEQQVKWSISETKQQLTGKEVSLELNQTGKYTVNMELINQHLCKTRQSKIIDYQIQHHIFAPTVFTPNGDGSNDQFRLKYKVYEGYNYHLVINNIYNGEIVFESQDPYASWDAGNINVNDSQNNEFIWQLIITDPQGRKETKRGRLHILMK